MDLIFGIARFLIVSTFWFSCRAQSIADVSQSVESNPELKIIIDGAFEFDTVTLIINGHTMIDSLLMNTEFAEPANPYIVVEYHSKISTLKVYNDLELINSVRTTLDKRLTFDLNVNGVSHLNAARIDRGKYIVLSFDRKRKRRFSQEDLSNGVKQKMKLRVFQFEQPPIW
ncbi:MAG: hypothetical protein HRT61_25130 [Ekhidna sp.]|nr:hypothetical protein [Ekhidna sp.]